MGTRSVTHIFETPQLGGHLVCSFFRHFDGYPSGHGKEMADWLKGKTIHNGKAIDWDNKTMYNRSGNMASKLMYECTDSDIEVIPTDVNADHGQDYTYYLKPDEDGRVRITIRGYAGDVEIPADEFDADRVDQLLDELEEYDDD